MNKNEKSLIHKTTIGGQAILEGIVMKGPEKSCTVVRKSNGELVIEEKQTVPASKKYPVLGLPVIRGVINFFTAMKEGIEAINFSAQFVDGGDEPLSPFEQWLARHFDEKKVEQFAFGFALVIGILLPIGLFILLPTLIAGLFPSQTLGTMGRNLLEGAVRILIFLCFMWSTSKMKDIYRTFCYHGGEHKTIHCYEKGLELTVENVRPQPRQHPRCGTSFLFVVMIISILVFSVVSWTNPIQRMVMRLVLLPVVVGISYEVNRFAGRHDNWFTHILRWPGIMLQNLTVFEPDDSMIEVAIEAMKRVIPQDKNSDAW